MPQVKVIRLFGSHPQRHSISGALYWQSHRIPGGQAERPALVDERGGQKYDGRGDTTKVPFTVRAFPGRPGLGDEPDVTSLCISIQTV